ncbi:hypothetical protein lerEdw1_011729, partial [Lerista edwardsae]
FAKLVMGRKRNHKEMAYHANSSLETRNSEGAGDFKALRAMFQNNSNFSDALLKPPKTPSAEIIPRPSTAGSSTSTSKHHPFPQVLVPNLEKKTEPLPCMLPKSARTPRKPVVLPRVKIWELPETCKNEHRKDFPETPAQGPALEVEPPNPHPKSCLYPQETAAANSSFHHTLHIWKNASSQNEPMRSVATLPCANRTMGQGQSRPSNVAEGKATTLRNEHTLVLATPKTPAHLRCEPVPSPTASPPIPPRRPVSLQIMERGTPKDTSFSSNAYALDRLSKDIQCSHEIHQGVDEIQLPKTKSLPSAQLLGPPPKKPPRPPKVDLSTFQQNPPGLQLKVKAFTMEPYPIRNSQKVLLAHSLLRKRCTKQRFPIATPSTEMEAVLKRGPLWDSEVSKQQTKEMGQIGDHGSMLAKMKINGDNRGGKNMLQEETTQSFPGTNLTKAGNYGYVSLETLKMDEEKAHTLELNPRTPQLVSAVEELYDDVAGLVQASDTISSFTSDTVSEETYEDIQSEDYNPPKLDDKVDKPKKFGKLFKKGKFQMKNTHLKENSRNLSCSVPNLDVMAQESLVYDDIGTEQDDTKEKNEIHKNWKLKFLMSKEKGRRRSSDEAEM